MSDSLSGQTDLFAGFSEPAGPVYRPDPDKVRARLQRIIGEASAANVFPWDPARLSLYRTIVPDLTRWLPDEEGDKWLFEFESQLSRFGLAA